MLKALLFSLLSLAGCTAGGSLAPLTDDNPASPAAAEAPLEAISVTLTLPEHDSRSQASRAARDASRKATRGGEGGHAHH